MDRNGKAILTFCATLAFVISPAFVRDFTGFEAEQLPIPQIDPPIQPAGYAFAIWGVIYAWLMASATYGLFKRAGDAGWDATRWPLFISLCVGAAWLAVAVTSPVWATVLIWVMLATALWALFSAPVEDRLWLQVPLALYAGWLTAASFVALGSVAAGYGLIAGSVGWAYLGMLGALLVAALVLVARPQAPEYSLTVIWALVGIIVANGASQLGVSGLAAAGAVVIGALAWRQMQRSV